MWWLAWRPTLAWPWWHVIDTLNDPPGGFDWEHSEVPKVQYEPMRGGHFIGKEQRHHLHRFQRPTLVLGKAGESTLKSEGEASWSTGHFPQILHCPGRRELSKGSSQRQSLAMCLTGVSPNPSFLFSLSLETDFASTGTMGVATNQSVSPS